MHPEPLAAAVGARWWHEHRAEVVLADVRWYLDGRSGRQAYEQGHLPGAVFVDLDRRLAGHSGPHEGRHPLPEPEEFAAGMSELGVADGDTVVAYDDAGGVIAARLVWMLRVTGHRAALLDGGLGAGARRCPGGLEFQTRVRPRAAFTARPWPADRLAGIDDAADRGNVVLDARNRDRYRGEGDPVDPRSGHIPGARNLPCRQNLAADATFLPAERLRRGFAAVGVRPGSTVVSYCGSGVTACHNLLALEIAGLGPGRLYPGSWSHYSRVPDRPMETGDPAGTPPP